MHIHILGICGTFMGSLAVLAKQMGLHVSGSDEKVYPPMSTQLQEQGIDLCEGFKPDHLQPPPDLVIIGNALSRGNPAVEYVLREGLSYTSGPQWLAQYVLRDRWVLGVAGTHGKTTTSAMLAWILEYAGLKPGYLIGGVTNNFSQSADLGDSDFFVVEADEYDSAFFDKRSKFIHYSSRTLVLNNLEFDHADIFENLEAIEKQFHHLIRTVPGNGLIIFPYNDAAIDKVLGMGCWTPRQQFEINVPAKNCQQHAENAGIFWNVELNNDHGSEFQLVKYEKKRNGEEVVNSYSICWSQTGLHNVKNALAALVAAHHVGVDVPTAIAALSKYSGVKRRMELRGEVKGIKIYDDFAHHPTAIKMTLNGIAARLQSDSEPARLIAVIEPRSATMKLGIHQKELNESCYAADIVLWYRPKDAKLDLEALVSASDGASFIFDSVDEIVSHLKGICLPGDNVVIMSNGGFEGIHDKVLRALG
jgi:UDP-N-acetylmuramate: L-alanyl-gamma-D-glutamyl-meso-diaminopimelate ligase